MRKQIVLAAAIALLAPTVGAFSLKPVVDAPTVPEPPSPEDATDPWSTVRILTDIAGAQLSGTIVIQGEAAAREGYALRSIEVWIDHQRVGSAGGKESWTYTLDTTRLLDGPHRMRVTAFASPDLPVSVTALGSAVEVLFETLNHLRGELLYEHTYAMTGASPEGWTHVLAKDYTNLRVTLAAESGPRLSDPPLGQLVLAFVDGADEDGQPRHVWTGMWGPLSGAGVVHRGETDVLHEGGVLALAGAFAGDGRVTLRVEALPTAPLAAA